MRRPTLLPLAAALVASATLLSATAAPAAYYAAKPVAAAATDMRLVVRSNPWRCGPDGCVSRTKGQSRAAHMCESLVRRVGAVSSFSAGGRAFEADALSRCNARAREAAPATN